MIRRTAFVRILTVSLPSPLIPETAVRWIPLTPSQRLAHRIMLNNLLHLLGMVKTGKSSHGFETRPAQVILPLSPNHGNFGNDWLYSESKLGLEVLFPRWHSESLGSYLTICGTIIGWTGATGLWEQITPSPTLLKNWVFSHSFSARDGLQSCWSYAACDCLSLQD